MAEEIIRYVYEADSSRLQAATQSAIDSLTMYESTVQGMQSTLDSLMSSINDTVDWVRLLVKEIADLVSMTATASDAMKSYKDSSTQTANALRSVASAQRQAAQAAEDNNKQVAQENSESNERIVNWEKLGKEVVELAKKLSHTTTATKEYRNILKDLSGVINNTTTVLKTLFGIDMANVLEKSAISAMDYIENLNLFTVAMGDSIDIGKNFVNQVQEIYGLDPSNIMTYVGNFNQLASAIEMPGEAAVIVSTNMTKMATDMASLFNMDVVDVVDNMRSGMIGMTRAVTKYGLDIRSTTLQQTALSLGITENVKNMSEANREGLRYITMMRQASNVSGDWAKTIESPSNQLRILKEQLTQLSRAIGNIFLPIISKVLPYINGFVMALREAVQAIAEFFGYTSMDFGGTTSTIDKETGALVELGDTADDTAKKIKNLRAPFDELNVLQADSSKASASTKDSEIMDPAIVSAIESLNVPLENIRMKANYVRDALLTVFNLDSGKLQNALQKIKNLAQLAVQVINNLKEAFKQAFKQNDSGNKILENLKGILKSIYNYVEAILQDTANWTANLDLGPLTESFANLSEAIGNVVDAVGSGLEEAYRNVLLPMAKWTIEKAAPELINDLADALNWFTDHPTITAILIGVGTGIAAIVAAVKGLITVVGIIGTLAASLSAIAAAAGLESVAALLGTIGGFLATIAPWVLGIVAAIAAIVAIVILVVTHLDEIKAWFNDMSTKMKPFFDGIKKGITGVYNFFKPLIDTIVAIVANLVHNVIAFFKAVIQWNAKVIEVVKKIAEVIKALVKVAWDHIKQKIFDPIGKWFSELYAKYLKPVVTWVNDRVIQPIFNSISNMATDIINVFIWLINLIISASEFLINLVVKAVNKLVKTANKVPGVNIEEVSELRMTRLEYLASGGVVSGPTQAVIGEGRYDEAVIPLGNSPQMNEMLDRFADKVGSAQSEVNVYIGGKKWDAEIYQASQRGKEITGDSMFGGKVKI